MKRVSLSVEDLQIVVRNFPALLPTAPAERLAFAEENLSSFESEEGGILLTDGNTTNTAWILSFGRVQVYLCRGEELEPIGVPHFIPGTCFGDERLPSDSSGRNLIAIALVTSRVVGIPKTLFRSSSRDSENSRTEEELSLGLAPPHKLGRWVDQLRKFTGTIPTLAPKARTVLVGQILYKSGEFADQAYFVLSGEIGLVFSDATEPHERVGVGLLFGAQEILENRVRTATAVALVASEVLEVEPSVLRAESQADGSLGTLLKGLSYVYAMPHFGSAYRYLAQVEGEACVVTDYQQTSGLRLRVRHFPLQQRTEAGRVESSDEASKTLHSPDGTISLIVAFNGELLGLTAPQYWSRLPETMGLLLHGGRLQPWQIEGFRSSGSLMLEDADLRASGATEIICGCTNTTATILRTAAQRSATLEDLMRLTGAGEVCGGCRNRLPTFLGLTEQVLCRLSTRPLAEGSLIARLEPVAPFVLTPGRVGQFVRVEVMMDGRWVGRPYTLTNSSTTAYELGVKINLQGLFSNWIRQAPAGALVRVSSPDGSICPEAQDPRWLIYFVGGVGVTPAIAGVRGLVERRIRVIYFYRKAPFAAYLEELRLGSAQGRWELVERETSTVGRMDACEIRNQVAGKGACEVVICGPSGFNLTVQEALKGVSGLTVQSESFYEPQRGEKAVFEPGAWRLTGSEALCPLEMSGTADEGEGTSSASDETVQFLRGYYAEEEPGIDPRRRIQEVQATLEQTGTWEKSTKELGFAARCAWRNAERCVGRLHWGGLHLKDCRLLREPDAIAAALWDHLQFAFNGGDLRPAITLFAPGTATQPGPRLWNSQLLRYAGYRMRSGKQIGDPAQNDLTQRIIAMGWKPMGTDFDVLPLVIETAEQGPRLYEVPAECRKEVAIEHPQHRWLSSLRLKWFAIPAVSDMALEAGGLKYRMAPFSGWYLSTEIAARNLTDVNRYNFLPRIAEGMGLDIRDDRSLWRDKALILLNEAVLMSFDRAGVTMVDHHRVGHEFLEFCRNEQKAGREAYGNWAWLVPPVSSSLSVLYQESFQDKQLKPAYVHQEPIWKKAKPEEQAKCPFY